MFNHNENIIFGSISHEDYNLITNLINRINKARGSFMKYKGKIWMNKFLDINTKKKLFETLVSKEEKLRAQDLGDYYCIPADSRDLNYNSFFIEGEKNLSSIEDYTSHNTQRLDRESLKKVLLGLDIIKDALND